MPNCFTLTRKGASAPSKFSDIDDEICAHLGVPSHPTWYYAGWYNTIGLAIACGKDWNWLRAEVEPTSDLIKVVDYLEAHYVSDAWAEIGRRG